MSTDCPLPPLAAYLVVSLASPALLAIVLSLIDRRAYVKRLHRMRRAG
jgi:hypothetical protein